MKRVAQMNFQRVEVWCEFDIEVWCEESFGGCWMKLSTSTGFPP